MVKIETGKPDDYAVVVTSGAWFGSLIWPGAVGHLVGNVSCHTQKEMFF